jgi:SAM-dependent methyltransferase
MDYSSSGSMIEWIGFDLDHEAVSTGNQRNQYREKSRKKKPVQFVTADLNMVPVADESIDGVLSSEVLEHFLDPAVVISEIARSLKPGGFFLFTTPNPHNLISRFGHKLNKFSKGALKKAYWKGHDEISAPPLNANVGYGHVSELPFRLWKRMICQAGFKIEKKIRGPIVFGSPFFDRHRFFSGLMIALDPILDLMPGKFILSENIGILCRKQA